MVLLVDSILVGFSSFWAFFTMELMRARTSSIEQNKKLCADKIDLVMTQNDGINQMRCFYI